MIRGVGFDLDGTLFDHRGSARIGIDGFFRSLGIAPSDEARRSWFTAEEEQFELWRAGSISFREQRRRRLLIVLPPLGAAVPDDPDSLDALFEQYAHAYRDAWRPFDDSATLLRALRRDGYRTGILTNGSHEQQVDKLRVTGLYDLVNVVCTSERIGLAKPDVGAFSALADHMGIPPAECLFVGDHAEHDVAGAESAGMSAVLVDRCGRHAEGIGEAVRAALAPWA